MEITTLFSNSMSTEQEALVAVTQKNTSLRNIPMAVKTETVCIEAVRTNVANMPYIIPSLKNKEFYHQAAAALPGAIEYIPSEFVSPEIALTAAMVDLCQPCINHPETL